MMLKPAYKTIGEIMATNTMRIRADANGMAVAIGLLSSHTPGAPVVDESGKFLGFISEFDLLKAVESGKNLNAVRARDLMVKERIAVGESTPIEQAVTLMEEKRLLNLPVEKDGTVVRTITRHDLLRAWLGIDLGIEL